MEVSPSLGKRSGDVLVEGLAQRARLLRTVEHRDTPDGLGDDVEKCIDIEGPVQADFHEPYLLVLIH